MDVIPMTSPAPSAKQQENTSATAKSEPRPGCVKTARQIIQNCPLSSVKRDSDSARLSGVLGVGGRVCSVGTAAILSPVSSS